MYYPSPTIYLLAISLSCENEYEGGCVDRTKIAYSAFSTKFACSLVDLFLLYSICLDLYVFCSGVFYFISFAVSLSFSLDVVYALATHEICVFSALLFIHIGINTLSICIFIYIFSIYN